jgi:tRNA 2-thiocytidine biosynthesis protein TtcA
MHPAIVEIVSCLITAHQTEPPPRQKASVDIVKLGKRLHRLVGQAIVDFAMIEAGDRVMVCVSGGKDSYSLLDILGELRQRARLDFEIVAVNLDQKQPGFPGHVLPEYLAARGLEFRIVEQDTYSVVKRLVPEGQTMCSLCSRLRRGALYKIATEIGATKIALGHHRDDMVQTLFMNMFFGGRMKGMPPKLVSDDGRHVVIRPLAYVAEADLTRWAAHCAYPIIPCNLCGSQANLQRVKVGQMLRDWEAEHPGRIDRILRAMGNVDASHLMDRKLYPFRALRADGMPDAAGDRAFDDDVAACAAPGSGQAMDARVAEFDPSLFDDPNGGASHPHRVRVARATNEGLSRRSQLEASATSARKSSS